MIAVNLAFPIVMIIQSRLKSHGEQSHPFINTVMFYSSLTAGAAILTVASEKLPPLISQSLRACCLVDDGQNYSLLNHNSIQDEAHTQPVAPVGMNIGGMHE